MFSMCEALGSNSSIPQPLKEKSNTGAGETARDWEHSWRRLTLSSYHPTSSSSKPVTAAPGNLLLASSSIVHTCASTRKLTHAPHTPRPIHSPIHALTHTHTHTQNTHAQTHTCSCIYMHIHTHTYTQNTHAQTHTCLCMCVRTHTHTHTHAGMHISTHPCTWHHIGGLVIN